MTSLTKSPPSPTPTLINLSTDDCLSQHQLPSITSHHCAPCSSFSRPFGTPSPICPPTPLACCPYQEVLALMLAPPPHQYGDAAGHKWFPSSSSSASNSLPFLSSIANFQTFKHQSNIPVSHLFCQICWSIWKSSVSSRPYCLILYI